MLPVPCKLPPLWKLFLCKLLLLRGSCLPLLVVSAGMVLQQPIDERLDIFLVVVVGVVVSCSLFDDDEGGDVTSRKDPRRLLRLFLL